MLTSFFDCNACLIIITIVFLHNLRGIRVASKPKAAFLHATRMSSLSSDFNPSALPTDNYIYISLSLKR